MLASLSIRDIVLVDHVDLPLARGLCVLTGETGAGKSILLDALGLTLGCRADRAMVRRGARQGSVTAVFEDVAEGPLLSLLNEQGIEPEADLIVRRTLGADGRSRAFVNDQPVSAALLKQIGALLVEVHGQNDQQGLLEPATQRQVLDAYGQLGALGERVALAHERWRTAEEARIALDAEIERTRQEEAYLRHVAAELEALAPAAGEEEALAAARSRLAARDKLAQAIDDATLFLAREGGVQDQLAHAARSLEKAPPEGASLLDGASAALDRARLEIEEAASNLSAVAATLETEAGHLDDIEGRLFALRDAARKHRVETDALPALLDQTRDRLEAIDAGESRLERAAAHAQETRAVFEASVRALGEARAEAAKRLETALARELPPLKLERATFVVRLVSLAAEDWGPYGGERVSFEVSTNPGETPGPIAKIASGGELARFMLALKVVLAGAGSTRCLVFDEVDAGVGGATADAVGERLARLAADVQVLVVTHAPQVAAQADTHLQVEKRSLGDRAVVQVRPLGRDARRDEIARMLAGATITDAARAAADSLIDRPV